MKKVVISLVAAGAVAWAVAPATAQQQGPCPPGSTGSNPYCEVPPPKACNKLAAKMSIARATLRTPSNTISVFAPITRLASGRAKLGLQSAGTTTKFTTAVNRGRIRTIHAVRPAQAQKGTGILTITYPGDADTRPQTVRLRSANNKAVLTSSRPVISNGTLRAAGTTTRRASGVVRVQLQYVRRSNGQTVTLELKSKIRNGRWSLRNQLSSTTRSQIAGRCGTVHSYVLFTGYEPNLIRGEMHSFQVLDAR